MRQFLSFKIKDICTEAKNRILMAKDRTFSQKFCNFVYIVLKYLLALGLTAIMCFPAIYHLSNEDSHNVQHHPLHKSFHTHPHQSLKQKLDSTSAAYLYGNHPQQIEHFVDYYIQEEILDGWKVVKWEFDSDADLTDYVPLNDIKLQLEKYIDIEQQRKTIWIISINGNRDKLYQVRDLMSRHPSDRIIVISDKKEKMANFDFFQIPEVSLDDFENALVQHLGITKKQAKILIFHYGSVHKTMENVDNDCSDIKCVLGDNYHTIDKLSNSEKKIMKQLCTEGTAKTVSSSKHIEQMGTFFHQDKYYWVNSESALNYQLQVSNQKPCKFVESGLNFWQMPGTFDLNINLDSVLQKIKRSIETDEDELTDQQQQAYEGWFEDQQHPQQQNQAGERQKQEQRAKAVESTNQKVSKQQ